MPYSCVAASALLLSMSLWCSPAATIAAGMSFSERLQPVRISFTCCAIEHLALEIATPQTPRMSVGIHKRSCVVLIAVLRCLGDAYSAGSSTGVPPAHAAVPLGALFTSCFRATLLGAAVRHQPAL